MPVVGYQSINVTNGFNMISLSFQPVDGSEEIAIQDLIPDTTQLIAGNTAGLSDRIQVWDGTQFTTYFYRAKKTTNPKFLIGPCWVESNNSGVKTTHTVKHGSGIWFARPESAPAQAQITISGAVNALPFTHDVNPGFNMIASAFPVDVPLNTMQVGDVTQTCPIDWAACGAVAGNTAGLSDRIQIWDGSQFTTYFYRAKKTTNPKFTLGPCWVESNNSGVKTPHIIPAGKGFWYARPDDKAAGTLIQTSPIAK